LASGPGADIFRGGSSGVQEAQVRETLVLRCRLYGLGSWRGSDFVTAVDA